MIFLYNAILLILLIVFSPVVVFKCIFDRRVGYKIKDRFFPSYKIEENNYMLFHASSFGEVKTILNVVDEFEKQLEKKSIFSVFTDTGYKFVKNRKAFIMPIDFYPIYGKIFSKVPDLALFFETEIWPSYISFLKNKGVKLVLINARMSDKSFKFYKLFSFLFKGTIKKFDLIIAKSEKDARYFGFFSDKVTVCGNLKQIKTQKAVSDKEKKALLETFSIRSSKPVFTFGSVHKEEVDFVAKAVSVLKKEFFIVVALRHNEDSDVFYQKLKSLLKITKRSEGLISADAILLDTMGELESIYKISDIVFIGGSTDKTLKGHNPIEPLVYNKFTIIGENTESFQDEVENLSKRGLLRVVSDVEELEEISLEYLRNKIYIDSSEYFEGLSKILDCYITQLKNKK